MPVTQRENNTMREVLAILFFLEILLLLFVPGAGAS
jgi:hypothetical protein